MKDSSFSWSLDKVFTIKIADLLIETGRSDEVVFEHKFSDQLPNLDNRGISGSFSIQSLDWSSLMWTLLDVHATFHEVCESCGVSFERSVSIPTYSARFLFEQELKKELTTTSEEVLFSIDAKSEIIDIEDMVVQSILLNDPFVKRCPQCSARLDSLESDEDSLEEYGSVGNVVFS